MDLGKPEKWSIWSSTVFLNFWFILHFFGGFLPVTSVKWILLLVQLHVLSTGSTGSGSDERPYMKVMALFSVCPELLHKNLIYPHLIVKPDWHPFMDWFAMNWSFDKTRQLSLLVDGPRVRLVAFCRILNILKFLKILKIWKFRIFGKFWTFWRKLHFEIFEIFEIFENFEFF